jgi:hypothetical protein
MIMSRFLYKKTSNKENTVSIEYSPDSNLYCYNLLIWDIVAIAVYVTIGFGITIIMFG